MYRKMILFLQSVFHKGDLFHAHIGAGTIHVPGGDIGDLVHDVHTVHDMAERGILLVEIGRVLMHDEKLISFCKENNIQIMSWGPLLRGNLENKKMEEIAEKYNKTTAQLLLRWNIQQGIIPIPKSKNEQRLQQNIDVFDFEITKEDMEELNHMNENHRTSFDPLTFDF